MCKLTSIKKQLSFFVFVLTSVAFSISSDQKLASLIESGRPADAVNEAHQWLREDPLALIPKVRGAEALAAQELWHSANYYLKKISAADWRKNTRAQLPEIFFRVYAQLSERVPFGELVEIPETLAKGESKSRVPEILFALGSDLYQRRRYPEASHVLALIPAGHALTERAALMRAATHARNREYAHGLKALSFFESPQASLAKARLAYAAKEFAQAEAFYEKAPQNPATLYETGATLIQLGRLKEALATLSQTGSENAPEALLLQTALALRLKDRSLARTAAERAEKAALQNAPLGASIWRDSLTALEREQGALKTVDTPAFKFLGEQLTATADRMAQRRQEIEKREEANTSTQREKLWVKARLFYAQALMPENKASEDYPSAVAEALRLIEDASEKTKGNYPEIEMRRAELSWKKGDHEGALRLADRVYRTFPNFRARAHNIFFLAVANLKAGNDKAGYDLLGEFLRLAPRNPRAADAHLLRGEVAFDGKRFDEAGKHYAQVLTFPRSKQVGFAYYKLGWVSYQQRKFDQALRWFEEAAVWSDQWEKTPEVANLEREARRDLISVYAENGDHRNAPVYFEKFLRGESKEWILELAKQLEGHGQYEKSSELYRYVMRKDPNNNDNLIYLVAIVRGQSKLRNWAEAYKAAKEVSNIFGPQLLHPPTEEKPDPAASDAEKTMRESVLALHADQKGTAGALVSIVDDHTLNYLRTYRNWPQGEPVFLKQAEWLARQKKWREALLYYRDYEKRFFTVAAPEMKERTLRGHVQALEALTTSEETKIASLKPDVASRELDEKVVEYQSLFPSSAYIRAISYTGAFSLLAHGELEKGFEACQKIFNFNPVDEQGKRCFNNMRSTAYRLANWKLVYEWATEIFTRQYPGIEVYRPELITIRSESLLKWAENEPQHDTAARTYGMAVRHRELYPIWEKALYNAFVRWNKGGNDVEALAFASRLEAEFPKSDFLVPVSATRAVIYQDAGDYTKAYPQLVFFLRHQKPGDASDNIANGMLNAGALATALDKVPEAKYWLASYDAYPRATVAGKALAKNMMNKLGVTPGRQIASIPSGEWSRLVAEKRSFESSPIPTAGSLPQRIKAGAAGLQRLARELLDLSGDQTFEGNEALCALPIMYSSLEHALRDLALNAGESTPQVLQIAVPLTEKAKELAQDCLKRAGEVEHDGPFFRQVNMKWGWEWDPIMSQRVQHLVRDLAVAYPRFDPIILNRDEESILTMHLQKAQSQESWYSLVRERCQKAVTALCRLTLTEALTKYPTSGKLLNVTATLFGKESQELPSSLYTRAIDQGSASALPNLAFYHLKEGRLTPGLMALRRASNFGAFEGNEELKQTIEPWVER